MPRAHSLSFQQPLAFAASGRRAVDRTPAARAARGVAWNVALIGLVVLLAAAYVAGYVGTVLAVGEAERAEAAAAEVASDLHDAERAAARGGALSYGDAAAIGLGEVAPRFVSATGAARALSMNGR
jgi:hypothetical protein